MYNSGVLYFVYNLYKNLIYDNKINKLKLNIFNANFYRRELNMKHSTGTQEHSTSCFLDAPLRSWQPFSDMNLHICHPSNISKLSQRSVE